MCIKQEFQLELRDIAFCNFLSPRRGEPNVMHSGRLFVEPMLSNSDIVKSDAIDPPRPFPVIINGVNGFVLRICIKIFAYGLRYEEQYMTRN
jgi:hypothetical protein